MRSVAFLYTNSKQLEGFLSNRYTSVYLYYVHLQVPRSQRRYWDTRVTDCSALPRRCWEPNLGPLQEQQVLLTTEPSLQPHCLCFSFPLTWLKPKRKAVTSVEPDLEKWPLSDLVGGNGQALGKQLDHLKSDQHTPGPPKQVLRAGTLSCYTRKDMYAVLTVVFLTATRDANWKQPGHRGGRCTFYSI